MEEEIKAILEENEQVLWSGRPEAFETLDKTHKKNYITSSIITIAVCAGLIIAYLMSIQRTGAEMKIGLPIIIAFIGIYMVANIFVHASQLRRKMGYAITNQRLILVKDEAKGTPFTKIPIAAMKTDEDGHTSLLCGDYAIKAAPRKWRSCALLGGRINSDTGLCDELVMYALAEPEKVREILKPYLTLN